MKRCQFADKVLRPGPGHFTAASPGCSPTAPRSGVPVIEVKQQKFARNVDADGYLRPVLSVPVTVPSDVPFGRVSSGWRRAAAS